MNNYELLFHEKTTFDNALHALTYISEVLYEKGIVKDTYLNALLEREKIYPTGVLLDGYAVAIPHCDAAHTHRPAIFIVRPASPVTFDRADDCATVDVSLIISLVVTHPADQLELLKALFSNLQNKQFYQFLLNASQREIEMQFNNVIFNQQTSKEAS